MDNRKPPVLSVANCSFFAYVQDWGLHDLKTRLPGYSFDISLLRKYQCDNSAIFISHQGAQEFSVWINVLLMRLIHGI